MPLISASAGIPNPTIGTRFYQISTNNLVTNLTFAVHSILQKWKVQVSILPTFYAQLFRKKFLSEACAYILALFGAKILVQMNS